MTCLVDSQYFLDPRDNFVRGWVGRLVEVDNTRADVGFEVCLLVPKQLKNTVRFRTSL